MQIQNKTSKIILGIIMVLLLTVSIFLPDNNYIHGQTLTLSITEPQERSEVCWSEWVKGNISDPKLQVYVLVRPKSSDKFLVQPRLSIADGKWEAYCSFGESNKGIGEQFEIIGIASRNKKLFKEGDTLPSPLPNNPDILSKSKPVIVTRASCLSPGEKGKPSVVLPQEAVTKEPPKEQTPKPETESTKEAKTGEEGGLLSSALKFLIITLVIVAVVGIGWLFYRIYRKFDGRIRWMESNMEQMMEGRRQFGGGKREGESYPSQEVSKIFGRMENIEREHYTYREKYREMVGEFRALQGIFLCLEDFFKKERDISKERVSLAEGILKEMNRVREKGIVYNGKADGRKPEEQIPQVTKIKLTEEPLIEWWNEFGNQLLKECIKTLNERFLNVAVEVISSGFDTENWLVIGISDNTQKGFFILPRRYTSWWTDYLHRYSEVEGWFESVERQVDASFLIKSLVPPLPKARKTTSGWELSSPKGKVSIKESQ